MISPNGSIPTDALLEIWRPRQPRPARLGKERLATLIPSGSDPQRRTLEWHVRPQGERETLFFALV